MEVEGWLPRSEATAAWGSATTGRRTPVRWPACESPRKPPGELNSRKPTNCERAGSISSDLRQGAGASRRNGSRQDAVVLSGCDGFRAAAQLWGVVMSVSAFNVISPMIRPQCGRCDSCRTILRRPAFEPGYSGGVWPYLSAEVALWHLRLGETGEAWRILKAMADRRVRPLAGTKKSSTNRPAAMAIRPTFGRQPKWST